LESLFYFVSCLRHMVEIKLATSLYVFVVFYNGCWDRAYSRTNPGLLKVWWWMGQRFATQTEVPEMHSRGVCSLSNGIY
jgi:hypothetical protein